MIEQKKTLIITTPYFFPHGGGLERYAFEIAKRIATSNQFRVVIITSGEYNGIDTREDIEGMRVYRLAFEILVSNTPFSFLWARKIKKIAQEENAALLNVHMPVPGIGDVAARAMKHVPLIVTYHAGSMKKGVFPADVFIAAYEYMLLPHLLRRAHKIICTSAYLAGGFLSRYADKSITLDPAVDSKVFCPLSTRKVPGRIIFVGGLSRGHAHKGLIELISSMPTIREQYSNVTLAIVGDGDERRTFETRVHDLGLSKCVTFKGRLEGESLVRAYQEGQLFVLPTSNDNMPLVILEAMACGLPIVSTSVGSIPGMVGEAGIIVPPHDRDKLEEAILLFFSNPEKMLRCGEYARSMVCHNFSWDQRVRAYVSTLSSLL